MLQPMDVWLAKAADLILDDLQQRKGIGNELDNVDAEVQEEIRTSLKDIIRETFLEQEGTKPGDTRVLIGKTGVDSSVQVWTGGEWLMLRHVTSLTVAIEADGMSRLFMQLYPVSGVAITDEDQVVWGVLEAAQKRHDES